MMKTPHFTLFSLLLLTGLAWSAPTPKTSDNLWLKTDSTWTRTDSYGIDRNHNGVIDEDEWVRTVKSGNARQSKPWNNVRPLREGETHQWEVEWEDSFKSAPPKSR